MGILHILIATFMFDYLSVKTVKDNVGILVKTLRNRENLSQEQLAEKLSMSRITIQNLESGKKPNDGHLIEGIAILRFTREL